MIISTRDWSHNCNHQHQQCSRRSTFMADIALCKSRGSSTGESSYQVIKSETQLRIIIVRQQFSLRLRSVHGTIAFVNSWNPSRNMYGPVEIIISASLLSVLKLREHWWDTQEALWQMNWFQSQNSETLRKLSLNSGVPTDVSTIYEFLDHSSTTTGANSCA